MLIISRPSSTGKLCCLHKCIKFHIKIPSRLLENCQKLQGATFYAAPCRSLQRTKSKQTMYRDPAELYKHHIHQIRFTNKAHAFPDVICKPDLKLDWSTYGKQ